MEVYVKETLYVIDYNNEIPEAELRNMIFTSDDRITPGYAYDITIKEANTGYSDLTFQMPNTILDEDGNIIKNPKLELLVPLVKVRYHREVYYTGEKEITVREPVGYGDTTTYVDRIYSPNYPDNLIEDYIMDYVVQPVDKKRNTLEIATTFTAIDYPRFTLSKKKVGMAIDNDTITKPEWSIVNPGEPIDRPGTIKYIAWNTELSKKVLSRADYNTDEEYNAACEELCHWNPLTATDYPLTKEQVWKLKQDQDIWPYGFEATSFYWALPETGRFKGILYEKGGWIAFQGYDLLGLQIAGLDPALHTENYAWHWTQIYAYKNYLTPNTARNYLNYILEGTAWTVDEVDTKMVDVYNPKDGSFDGEVEYTANLSLSGSNCYNAITSLCQNFQLYPVFDCLHRKVSLRLASGKNYGLIYRLGDNIKSDSTKADGEKVITKLYVTGGSDNVGSANINIGTATREYLQVLQGFYNNVNDLNNSEVKGQWAVVDPSLTNFNTITYELDYHTDETITIDYEVTTMPEPSASIVNKVYKYVGATTDHFTNNFVYKCILEDDGVTYGWLDVTGEPYLKQVATTTHGLDTPNYWEAGANRGVYFRDNGAWVLGTKQDSGLWTHGDYVVDPISGMLAPWDPNDDSYVMSRSPYWTNFIMNLRWYYDNGWISKEQILELYQYNLEINNLNKAFGDKYIEDRRATQTAYENAKNNYDIAQDGFESTLYAMENKYYLVDGDYSQGYDYCFHVAPKDVSEETDSAGKIHNYIKLFHCYSCGHTEGIPCLSGRTEGNDISACPVCGSEDVVNNKIEVLLYDAEKYTTNELSYPYGTDYTHIYGQGYVGGYKYNPQLKGYFLRLVTALDKMDSREQDRWDVEYYENNISVVEPIEYEWNDSEEMVFDQYTYKINNVYVRSASGQIEVWNEAVKNYIKYYGQMLDNKRILDASIKHIQELEDVYESWNTIVQGLFENIQLKFGDFVVEGNYQNSDQPYVAILFNEGLEASDKYSIPEITYDLDVVASTGLIEYRQPMITRYVCANCGRVHYEKEPQTCVVCGKDVFYREQDIYNDLVKKLHSVGQIVPKAGDYVSIYDEPMGFFGVPGLITEVDRYLDQPIKNSIKLDTSYTNEEQLVGNIINATNTVLSNKDIYARTAYINADGTLDPDSIKDTLNTSGADISIVSTGGSILLNGSGLRCIDPSNPSNAIKYTGTGVYKTTNLDNENGDSQAVIWERMMTPEGINATYINSGTIDTNKINITAGSGSKVIMDKFGLYVKTSTNASAHITEFDSEKAKRDKTYAATWGNYNNLATFVGIDNKNNPLIYTRGFLVAQDGSNIANWITDSTGFYHLANTTKFVCPECDYQSSVNFTTCPNCHRQVEPVRNYKDLWLSPEGMSGEVNSSSGNFAFYANGNFGVTTSGNLYANNANIKGTITATDGKIAGFDINGNILKGTNVGMCGLSGEEWAFWAGANAGVSAPFHVGHDGSLYASSATITGKVTATSGEIKNCTMSNCSISAAQITEGSFGSARIANGAVTADKLSVNSLSAISANLGSITSGNISIVRTDDNAFLTLKDNRAANLTTLELRPSGMYSTACDIYTNTGASRLDTYIDGLDKMHILSGSSMELRATKIYLADANNNNYIYYNNHSLYGEGGARMYVNNAAGFVPSSGSYAYVGEAGVSSNRIKTNGGDPSSLNIKTDLQEIDSKLIYKDIQEMKLYNYNYKYQGLSDNNKGYGFIIDYMEKLPTLSKYTKHYETKWCVDKDRIFKSYNIEEDRKNYEILNVKEWDKDSYIKLSLIMIKALQEKIDELEDQIKKKA